MKHGVESVTETAKPKLMLARFCNQLRTICWYSVFWELLLLIISYRMLSHYRLHNVQELCNLSASAHLCKHFIVMHRQMKVQIDKHFPLNYMQVLFEWPFFWRSVWVRSGPLKVHKRCWLRIAGANFFMRQMLFLSPNKHCWSPREYFSFLWQSEDEDLCSFLVLVHRDCP